MTVSSEKAGADEKAGAHEEQQARKRRSQRSRARRLSSVAMADIDWADMTRAQEIVSRHSLAERAIKRVFDIVFSLLGLVATAPLVALLSVLIRIDSRGAPFLRQPRIGLRGRTFNLLKLRTMHDGVQVTRLGRFLRPPGIDELPQLWNVLKGEMSLVGPRPERPHLVGKYQGELPGYRARHLMRPGITGWAQVNGLRGPVSIADRLRFDLQYICTWNFCLDLRCLSLTVAAVWRDTARSIRS